MKKKILLIRLDKIGDLVSTLPVDEMLPATDYEVTWVIQKGMAFICQHSIPPRSFIEIDKTERSVAQKKLRAYLQESKPDIAVSFQSPWWVNYELFRAGIPLRTGVQSQWHSWLFLNQPVRQKRSLALKHEADYNAELIQRLLNFDKKQDTPILKLASASHVQQIVSKLNLQSQSYFVIHPGMAGSAKNWSQENYISLVQKLKKLYPVLITGTPADESYLSKIKIAFVHDPQVLILQNKLSTDELLVILENAKAIIAPSTGVAHLAASLGRKVICLMSPILVQKALRWGPRGIHVHNLTPIVSCLERFHCAEKSCKDFDCMDLIEIEQVYNAAVSN